MNIKRSVSLFLCIIMITLFGNAQTNVLSITDVTIPINKTISLPINLDNNSDIVAVEFNLQLPAGISILDPTVTLSDRADDHVAAMHAISADTYKVIIYSPSNSPFIGRTGKILSIPITSSTSLEEGGESPLTLSSVVLSGKDGSNLLTSFMAGKVIVAKSPDFEVSNVIVSESAISPESKLSLSWNVSNKGDLSTSSGWSEQIFLEGIDGTAKLIATIFNDNILAAGATISRSAELVVPKIIGIDGSAKVEVRLNANSDSGEPSWLCDNNTAQTFNYIKIERQLYLVSPGQSIEEATTDKVQFQLTRSGSTTTDETFTLTHDADSRILLPETVTISKGQSGIYFYAQISANGALDNDSIVNFTIYGNDYPEVESKLVIEDDTYPSLYITTDSQNVTEGESIMFTVSMERVTTRDIELMLSCDLGSRFELPHIIIPAGQQSVDIIVNTIDDVVPNIEQDVTFVVSAARYNSASTYVTLFDNDVPTLKLEITPNAISEAAGPLSLTAKLTRTDNIDKLVTVKLSDDSNGNIYYGRQTIEMAVGVEEVTVNLGPIDNIIVDGERTYNIDASVYIASCSCNVNNSASGGVVSVPLTIYDNDGATITMTTSSSILNEGGEIGVTVKRNTETTEAVTVYISSDYEDSIDFPSTVIIPIGANETTFTVKSKNNDISGDSFTAMLTASADNYTTGNVWFAISDQTLPDVQVTDIKVNSSSLELGETVSVLVSLANTGNATLPASVPIKLYSGNQSNEVAAKYTIYSIEAGHSMDVIIPVDSLNSIGTWPLFAVINGSKLAQELEYTNNTSKIINVEVKAPFSVTTNIPKSLYDVGEEVVISGQASGRNFMNANVEIYIINQGHRYVLNTITDSEGCFNVAYTPFERQFGHFAIGACFPGEKLVDEQCYFDIYGMQLSDNSAITCDVLKNEIFSGSILINNPGVLTLNNITAKLINELENCEIVFGENINTLEGGESQVIDFKIKGINVSPNLAWEIAELQIVSDEGAIINTKLYYYVREPQGKLDTNISSINTSVTLGTTRDYAIELTNIGNGDSGDITFALPSWMHLATASQIPSLATGASSTVVLAISTNEQMSANVTKTGHIGVNCENGIGLSIPFTIEPVSEKTGIVSFDICDEFTYYTAEAPHVSSAKIQIKHPVTGELITEGVSDAEGKYRVNLPEGYYSISVTADKHESYSENIYVDPGRTNDIKVNIGYTAITYDFVVEETEIEDEYKIVTKVEYETNVPVPCVILSVPEKIDGDNMQAGESTLVYFALTNKGLITAMDVTINMPENTDEWRFEALTNIDPFDLSPQQAVSIPVRITRLKDENSTNSSQNKRKSNIVDYYRDCMTTVTADYSALCGNDLKSNKAAERMAMKMCGMAATGATIYDALSSLFSGSGLGLSPNNTPSSPTKDSSAPIVPDETTRTVSTNKSFTMCDPCDAAKAEKLLDMILDKTFLKPINVIMNMASQSVQNSRETRNTSEQVDREIIIKQLLDNIEEKVWDQTKEYIIKKKLGLGDEGVKAAGWIEDIINVVKISAEKCDDANESKLKSYAKSSSRSWQDNYNNVANQLIDYIANYDSLLFELFGDKIWYDSDLEDKEALFELLFKSEAVTLDQALAIKPLSVTDEQVKALYDRINNSVYGNETTNCINWDNIESIVNISQAIDDQSVSEGYESFADQFQDAYDICVEQFGIMSSSVCASITLQFSQNMTMTRQAFRGTLTVFNGNESTAMTDVKLELTVKDENGNLATSHEFQINAESLAGFEGLLNLTDGWTLDAQETGLATILFIPTKYAASNENKLYYFGGSLSYVDPFTGLKVTRTLTPIALTVKPSPNLNLTYFMQRDILGDDPLTEVVEPSEEAEFALLINNAGYGDATSVQMLTEQPKIIDNEKGLAVDFEIINSQLNGKDKTLSLGGSVATDFGTISALNNSYAQWWFKSSLLGHFTDYSVEATHVSSYDNPDLSLLNVVAIHELIRSLEIDSNENKMVGFMTNDISDADDTPDMIYLSNGEIKNVASVQSTAVQKYSNTEYLLTVVPAQEGWNYGSVSDPTYGTLKLKSIVRQNDSKEISLRNFWQTDRTLRDGKDPLYENRIHFADDMVSLQEENYILTFEPKPVLELEVQEFIGVQEENSVLKEQLKELTVKFNKPIKTELFTTEDISIYCQGKAQDSSRIVITKVTEQEYLLELNEVTLSDGYYVLTVQTANIIDNEGFVGSTGKQTSWTQFVDGKVALIVKSSPSEGGSITPSSGRFAYDTDIVVKAVPSEGYDFVSWSIDGNKISTESEYTHHLINNTELTAEFSIKYYSVSIGDNTQNGTVEGGFSGIYKYGTEFQLRAIPKEEYIFDAWLIDDERDSESELYTIIVNRDVSIDALFKLTPSAVESMDTEALRIKISPIPLQDMMYITGNFNEIQMVNIYDMRGAKCLSVFNVQSDESIYLGRLNIGIYYIQIITDKGNYTAKVLKR